MKDCLAVEGTVDLVFDDNASFTFLVEKAIKNNGRILEFVLPERLFFTAAPVVDNEPVFVGDKIRVCNRDGGFIFPENLTQKAYTPLSDVLIELNKDNCLLLTNNVVVDAVVDTVFVGFSDNVWLRLGVTYVSTDTMCQNFVRKPVSLHLGDYGGLFDSMPDTVKNNIKIALKKVKKGDNIRIKLSSFAVVEDTELRCNNICVDRKVGETLQPLEDLDMPLIDISELWT